MPPRPIPPVRGVLFDLDGTLLDTAPDLGATLNALLLEHGLPILPHERIRPHVSRGSRALVTLGFGAASPAEHAPRIERFLALYSQRLAVDTRPFQGVLPLLAALESQAIPWGIVTNKPGWLAEPLLRTLDLLGRAKVLVCGDTLPERKPSPLPLLHASEKLGVPPSACIFVGDAELDMLAARAAGMPAIAARYGYFGPADSPERWPTDAWIDSPLELLEWLGSSGP
jgi:N-acetyl-D-muramate 6-phosphate phosphatase